MKRIDNIYEVTKRLCGDIIPYGDSAIDRIRMQNLEDTISVAMKLIDDIYDVSKFADRKESSIREMGKAAKNFIYELHEKTPLLPIMKDKNGKDIFLGDRFKFKLMESLDEHIELTGSFCYNEEELRYEIDIWDNSTYTCLYYKGNGEMYGFELLN